MRAAVTAPFASDGLAASLLLHNDPSIKAQVLAGVRREDCDALANQFEETGSEPGHWSAAKLYLSLASIAANLSPDSQCEYYLKSLNAVRHMRADLQPGALALEIRCRNKM